MDLFRNEPVIVQQEVQLEERREEQLPEEPAMPVAPRRSMRRRQVPQRYQDFNLEDLEIEDALN